VVTLVPDDKLIRDQCRHLADDDGPSFLENDFVTNWFFSIGTFQNGGDAIFELTLTQMFFHP